MTVAGVLSGVTGVTDVVVAVVVGVGVVAGVVGAVVRVGSLVATGGELDDDCVVTHRTTAPAPRRSAPIASTMMSPLPLLRGRCAS